MYSRMTLAAVFYEDLSEHAAVQYFVNGLHCRQSEFEQNVLRYFSGPQVDNFQVVIIICCALFKPRYSFLALSRGRKQTNYDGVRVCVSIGQDMQWVNPFSSPGLGHVEPDNKWTHALVNLLKNLQHFFFVLSF